MKLSRLQASSVISLEAIHGPSTSSSLWHSWLAVTTLLWKQEAEALFRQGGVARSVHGTFCGFLVSIMWTIIPADPTVLVWPALHNLFALGGHHREPRSLKELEQRKQNASSFGCWSWLILQVSNSRVKSGTLVAVMQLEAERMISS